MGKAPADNVAQPFRYTDALASLGYVSASLANDDPFLDYDVTTGYGPECFNIPGSHRAYPYKLQAHYYSRGPMGYGMGKLEIIEHDGKGGLRFEERPFNITVSLGVVFTTGDATLTAAGLMRLADDNMYQAKRAGRNRVVSCQEDRAAEAQRAQVS